MNLLLNLMVISGGLVLVGIGFTYHLGWKHGWNKGLQSGRRIDSADGDEEQPSAKGLLSVLYVLGWHHGWDYGFRKGSNSPGIDSNER